jgi:hypothetical protein
MRLKHPNQTVEKVLMMNGLNTKITMMLMPENKHLGSLMINKSKARLELSKAILLSKVLNKVKY